MSILETRNLKTYFPIKGGVLSRTTGFVKAVNDVSINIGEGEIVSVVGESGCGKSTLGLSTLGLVEPTSGEIFLEGEKIDVSKPASWNKYRKDFQVIFQDPFTSLNPRHTIYSILKEALLFHKICTADDVSSHINKLLTHVGLSPDYAKRFPHAFSGGQRQRISIARSICVKPKLIVCDEVVSALDVSVQAQIIDLLLSLKKEMNLSLLFIAHDLSLVKSISDRVYVMYLGKIVESAPSEELFNNPIHPYTEALLASIPTLDKSIRPQVLEGEVPSPSNLPKGCAFAGRCRYAEESCNESEPDLFEIYETHSVRCPVRTEKLR